MRLSVLVSRTHLLGVLLVSLLAVPALAVDGVDYEDYVHWINEVETPALPFGSEVQGDLLHMITIRGSYRIYDISSPATPSLVGELEVADLLDFVDVEGDRTYLAARDDGLQILDISDPTTPVPAGNLKTSGRLYAVVVAGGLAYTVEYVDGVGILSVVDVSDPASLSVVGSTTFPDFSRDVYVRGSYVFVLSQSAFHVVDVADPATPSLVHDVPMSCRSADFAGDYAYVTGGMAATQGVFVIDISDPAQAFVVGSAAVAEAARDIAVAGQIAYVASNGLVNVDVSDPANPMIVGSVGAGLSRMVEVVGPVAYVGAEIADDEYRVQVVDVSNPGSPEPTVDLALGDAAGPLVVDGDFAYCGARSLAVVDVGDPLAPVVVAQTAPFWGVQRRMAKSGDYLLSMRTDTDAGGWLRITDVSDPSNPVEAGGLGTGPSDGDVAAFGSYAYVGSERAHFSDLLVVDVSDPGAPFEAAREPAMAGVLALSDPGDVLYSAGVGHLRVLDVSNPLEPTELGDVQFSGRSANDVYVDGNFAYVTDEALHILDVSDSAAPIWLSTVNVPVAATGVTVTDGVAYVAAGESGVQAVDVSIPTAPRLAGAFNTTSIVPGIAARAGHLLVNDIQSLFVLPPHCEGVTPVWVSGFAASTRGETVELSWATAVEGQPLAFNVYRSQLLDGEYERLNSESLEGPSPFRYVDSQVQPQTTYFYRLGMAEFGDKERLVGTAFVATSAWTVPRTALSSPFPNPFSGETELEFSLDQLQMATLNVYDVAGRLVRSLVRGPLPAGSHRVVWDGRDGRGRSMAGGVYFVRFVAEQVESSEKVVLLRDR